MGPHVPLLCAAIVIGGVGAAPSVAGKWDTPQGLRLTLTPEGRFVMGSPQGNELYAGTWVQRGDAIALSSRTLRGKPIEASLREQIDSYAPKMSPGERKAFLAAQLREMSPTLDVGKGGKELIWRTNGQQAVFTPARKRPLEFTETELAKGLRKGMGAHEVMTFFRESSGEARSTPGDPTRITESYRISMASKPRTVLVTYLYKNGAPGLERVDLLDRGRRHRIAIH